MELPPQNGGDRDATQIFLTPSAAVIIRIGYGFASWLARRWRRAQEESERAEGEGSSEGVGTKEKRRLVVGGGNERH